MNTAGFGLGGAGAASLRPALAPAAAPVADWRTRLADLDLVVDLGFRIGSRSWWRGLATCTALCASAFALAPGIGPLVEPSPARLSPAHSQEARAIAVSPLAYGADTGRRMTSTDVVEPLIDTPERPSVDLVATLGQGDGFARVLERAGVAHAQAVQVADMVANVVPLEDLKPGMRMDVTLGRRANRVIARPLDALAFRARFDLKLALARNPAGALTLRRVPIAVDDTPLRVQGRVGSSLYVSARAAGAPAKAVETYIRALAGRMSIGSDVHAGDRFDIIVEHRRAQTGESETGELLFAGLDQGTRRTQLLKWTVGDRVQWFEASGVGERRGLMMRPVAGGHQTSGFGMRFHPLLGFTRFHKGIDIAAAYGTPIVAATDGVVNFSGWHGGHGNFVRLAHAGGLATGYGHMSRIAARVGQQVHQGQLIGYVGSTGLSTGPHLHYEVYRNNVAINPNSVSFTMTSQLAGGELARFRGTLARLMAIRPGAPVARSAGLDASKPAPF